MAATVEAHRTVVVRVPMQKLWDVLTDFKSYPEFVPGMRKVRIKNAGSGLTDLACEVDVDLEALGVSNRLRYTLRMNAETPGHISWTLVDGDLAEHRGTWELKRKNDGETRATCTVRVGVKNPTPKVVSTVLASQHLPLMVEGVKRRAEATSVT